MFERRWSVGKFGSFIAVTLSKESKFGGDHRLSFGLEMAYMQTGTNLRGWNEERRRYDYDTHTITEIVLHLVFWEVRLWYMGSRPVNCP